MKMKHPMPDINRIPKALQPLVWQMASEDQLWTDGDTLLAAVSVSNPKSQDGWHYEFSVVQILCYGDDSPASAEADGEVWCWNLESIDWFVKI